MNMKNAKTTYHKPYLLYVDENEDIIFQAFYLFDYGRISDKKKLRRGLKNQYPSANMFKIEAAIKSVFQLNKAVNLTFDELYYVRDSHYEKVEKSLRDNAPCLSEKAYDRAISRTWYFLMK